MPTCQAFKCTNNTGRMTKGESFFKIPEPKNATERKRAQQWLHNMVMGQFLQAHHVVLPSPVSSSLEPSFSETLPFFSFILSISSCEYSGSLLQQPRVDSLSDSEVVSNSHSLILSESLFHLTLLQFRNQVDTSILIVCIILKFWYSCFSFCFSFSLIFSMRNLINSFEKKSCI